MANSIDQIIQKCEDVYGLRVDGHQQAYAEFLGRQLRAHPEYDLDYKTKGAKRNPYPYFNLLVDKLLLFSYLIGQIPIHTGVQENPKSKRIKTVYDLKLLSQSEIQYYSQRNFRLGIVKIVDSRLYSLYGRINTRKRDSGFQNWEQMIDELGKDTMVMRYFGERIGYDQVRKRSKPHKKS